MPKRTMRGLYEIFDAECPIRERRQIRACDRCDAVKYCLRRKAGAGTDWLCEDCIPVVQRIQRDLGVPLSFVVNSPQ